MSIKSKAGERGRSFDPTGRACNGCQNSDCSGPTFDCSRVQRLVVSSGQSVSGVVGLAGGGALPPDVGIARTDKVDIEEFAPVVGKFARRVG